MARSLQRGLTEGQARLLERHRRGVVRVAMALSGKRGCDPTAVIVLLAHRASTVGRIAGEHLDAGAGDLVVIPGVLQDLPRWIERLAVTGPVSDCTTDREGVAVIVVDGNGGMALCRVECGGAATGSFPLPGD